MSSIAANQPSSAGDVKKGPILFAMLLGAFVAFLNQTLLNVALPSIMGSLNITETTVQWLATGFMLVNGVLMPVTAYLMAKFTTRQIFITGMSLFTIGTLLCGISPNFAILMTGRVIQAAGAGIMMPLLNVVVLNIFPIEQRGKAMGTIGIAMILAPAIGPTLSGYIVENYDWRTLFWIILPIAIISILIGMRFVKNVTVTSDPKLDMVSVVLSTLGFGGLLYGFSDAGSKGWGDPVVISCLAVGAIALLIFIIRQFKLETPLLEFRVFKNSMYSLNTVILVVVNMAMFSGMILLPIYLQNTRGISAFDSGLLMLPGAIVMGIMSPITGGLFDKFGAKWLSIIGLVITAVTTYEFSKLTMDTSYNHLILMYTFRMFGMSLLMMPIQTAALNDIPQRLNAHGTVMLNTMRTVFGAIGTAVFVTIYSSSLKQYVLDQAGVNMNDPAAVGKLAQQSPQVLAQASIHGINFAFIIAAVLTVVALVLAFFIKKSVPKDSKGFPMGKPEVSTSQSN
ncbi:DHA2 family efflux MFS transporter permease subunit [Paenibacillus polygoni]|uniref:DHA2 family efflux MFS transporter permease subunit n=1 Tax=Paenibacillus polygoni TaxID=3050112 RepID=A0ABY8WZP0_9BACL|nr:DHA2 family efflux MFS transporter permease subunit [Paenibacillus polygoni]WIV17879.1 DHA2 family efflux MFS transporter permease subunit [Paenibacillus polygoni]